MVKYVYVACPYTGDPIKNTNTAIKYANQLVDAGFVPIVPHISTVLWNLTTPKPESFWLQYVMELMRICCCVVRFPGESKGADNEEREAKLRGIPVFYSIDELLESTNSGRE